MQSLPFVWFTDKDPVIQTREALIKNLRDDRGQQVFVEIALVKPTTPLGPIFTIVVLYPAHLKSHYLTIFSNVHEY